MMKGITVLFENEAILVLNKPSGLPVQGGKGISVSLDVLLSQNRSPPPRLVHRLDKDTSGLMVTAKTGEEAARLTGLFARGGIRKHYLAVCAGTLPEGGTINAELERKGRSKKAETRYRRICSGDFGFFSCSLTELKPATGREHQIRRHLAGIGFPILGDDKYGNFSLNRALKRAFALKRLLLHACFLGIPLQNAEPLIFTAPPPDYFLAFLERIGMSRERPPTLTL